GRPGHRALGGRGHRGGPRWLHGRRGQRVERGHLGAAAVGERPGSEPMSSNHVLIVDDDDDMLEMLAMLLHKSGFSVRTAHNGRQALQSVQQEMPALILLDMVMPVMNGWEFARSFRAH